MSEPTSRKRFDFPNLGLGLGLRTKHYDHVLDNHPNVDWFEIISENYMDSGGKPRHILNRVLEAYPIVMHGVSMSIGSTDELNMDYLASLKKLRDDIGAPWVSDHLCWTGVAGRNMHDLLPMPYTEESLKHVVRRVRRVQEFLEAPLLLENPSSYLEFTACDMHEADFLRHLAEEADCGLLLDVNNVYVSAFNHEFDPKDYLDRIPHDRVVQYHLAGHTHNGDHILDTHSAHVIDEVWELLRYSYDKLMALAPARAGGDYGAAVMVEWDDDIPDFSVVHDEVLKGREFIAQPEREAARGAK